MKYIQATVRVDPDEAPTFFNLLANSPKIEEARVLDVNTTLEGIDNYLFAIIGDPTTLAEEATDTPGVASVDLSETRNGITYAVVVVNSLETPMYDAIQRASSQGGLVIRTPLIYRDGKLFGRGVGDPKPLQQALEDTPDALDVQIDEIGRFRGGLDDPVSTLSDRQQEALKIAQELGYYDQPRGATHEDVAKELGCAPVTASDHLQKAEGKVVNAVLDKFGPSV